STPETQAFLEVTISSTRARCIRGGREGPMLINMGHGIAGTAPRDDSTVVQRTLPRRDRVRIAILEPARQGADDLSKTLYLFGEDNSRRRGADLHLARHQVQRKAQIVLQRPRVEAGIVEQLITQQAALDLPKAVAEPFRETNPMPAELLRRGN